MTWSRRFKLAAFGGTAMSALLFMLADSFRAEWLWRVQAPGVFASLATFGVHGGGRLEFDGLLILVNSLAFSLALLVILSLSSLRSKAN
jgi:hypothetical protein